jgi:AbrB family looped-hinge helix DNA binding protein
LTEPPRYSDVHAFREIIATVTGKGQVTIPAEVRQQWGTKTHQKIAFVLEEGGKLAVKVPRYPIIASIAARTRDIAARGALTFRCRQVRRAQILLAADGQEDAASIAKGVGRVRQTIYFTVCRRGFADGKFP